MVQSVDELIFRYRLLVIFVDLEDYVKFAYPKAVLCDWIGFVLVILDIWERERYADSCFFVCVTTVLQVTLLNPDTSVKLDFSREQDFRTIEKEVGPDVDDEAVRVANSRKMEVLSLKNYSNARVLNRSS